MRYFITTTEWAEGRSMEEAVSRNCGPTTRFWWSWVVKWDDPLQAALVFSDTDSVPEDCQPTVDELPADWYAPETTERAIAEERERGA